MLIRNNQMNEMAVPSVAIFLERAVNFLYDNFPESQDEDPEELTEAVGGLIDKAETYDLVTEQQVMTYITSAWLLSLNFDEEYLKAKEKLNSKDLTPDEKADWLAKWTEKIFAALEEEK